MIVGRGPGGQPVHDRRLGAATSVPPLPERQRDAGTVRGRTISAWGILRDSGWNGIELRPLDIACAMPHRKLVGYDRSGRRGAAERRQTPPARRWHGDEVHFIAACWMVTAPPTTLGPEATGDRGAVPPALCSKLCSDRDASRHIGRHRTELRLREIDRKSRVLACFVTAGWDPVRFSKPPPSATRPPHR